MWQTCEQLNGTIFLKDVPLSCSWSDNNASGDNEITLLSAVGRPLMPVTIRKMRLFVCLFVVFLELKQYTLFFGAHTCDFVVSKYKCKNSNNGTRDTIYVPENIGAVSSV